MQKIVTAAQMREIDRRTIEDRGIPSLILMENMIIALTFGGYIFYQNGIKNLDFMIEVINDEKNKKNIIFN